MGNGFNIVDVLLIVMPPHNDRDRPWGRSSGGGGGNNNNNNNRVNSAKGGRWMWHGGGAVAKMMLPHGTATMYCPPSNANRVLKVRLVMGPYSSSSSGGSGGGYNGDGGGAKTIEPDLSWSRGQNKWYSDGRSSSLGQHLPQMPSSRPCL